MVGTGKYELTAKSCLISNFAETSYPPVESTVPRIVSISNSDAAMTYTHTSPMALDGENMDYSSVQQSAARLTSWQPRAHNECNAMVER